MTRRTLSLLPVLALLATPVPAVAGSRDAHVLEVGLWSGFVVPLDRAGIDSAGGPSLGVQIRYRAPSGLHAFVEGGWAALGSSEGLVADRVPGQPGRIASSLDTWLALGGIGVDVWRIRLEGGIGAAVLAVRSTLDGVTVSTHLPDLVYSVAATGFLAEGRGRVGIGVRALFIDGNDTRFLVFTLHFGGDVLSIPRGIRSSGH